MRFEMLYILTIIMLVAILGILGAFVSNPRINHGFSELYFVDVPKIIFVDDPFNISFVIQNHENRDITYDYTIELNSSPLDRENIHIRNGGSALIEQSLVLFSQAYEGNGENNLQPIQVKILNNDEEIHSWVEII